MNPPWIGYLLFCFLLNSTASLSAETKNLTVGVFPYFSAAKLFKLHTPVINRLNSTVDKSFTMVSASGFGEFIKRTKAGNYDLVITAPHMGRLAEMQSGYQRVAMTGNKSYAVFVVKNKSSYQTLSDIKGESITLPPAKAIISKMALKTMEQAGLEKNDVKLNYTKSHNNALLSVIRDESKVAAFGYPTWKRYPAKDKKSLRVLAISEKIPGFLIMANPRLDAELVSDISESLIDFEKTDSGKAYFSLTALERFIPVDDGAMIKLTDYVTEIFKLRGL